jgi:hypothetical protein
MSIPSIRTSDVERSVHDAASAQSAGLRGMSEAAEGKCQGRGQR